MSKLVICGEGNVTTRRELYNEHIRSLGFLGIRDGVTL